LKGSFPDSKLAAATIFSPPPAATPSAAPTPPFTGPDAPHLAAQDEAIKAGKKLADQEK
jgi:hypothetical protein